MYFSTLPLTTSKYNFCNSVIYKVAKDITNYKLVTYAKLQKDAITKVSNWNVSDFANEKAFQAARTAMADMFYE